MSLSFLAEKVDNLDNSSELAVTRIREVVGEALGEKLEFSLVDLLDCEKLSKLFADKKYDTGLLFFEHVLIHKIIKFSNLTRVACFRRFDSVIHFAGLKAVRAIK